MFMFICFFILVIKNKGYNKSGKLTSCFKMFWKKSPENARKNVEDVILLFTDGRPEADDPAAERAKADQYSKILKNEKNIKIIGVAAGDVSSYRSNIQSWASSPDLVFEAGKVKELGIEENVNKLVEQLKNLLCCGKRSRRKKLYKNTAP